MKKLINLAVLAIIAMTFANCTDPVQSSFEIDDIPTKAKITGRLSYNAGMEFQNDIHLQLIKPAANKIVYFEIENASITPNGTTANGYTVFTDTTDANGVYCFENIPAVYSGTNVTVRVENFIETYKEVKRVVNDVPEYETTETFYYIEPAQFTLMPNQTRIHDAVYEMEGREVNEPYKYNCTFTVNVYEPQYIKANNGSGIEIKKTYVGKSSANVIATINGIHYGATTDKQGKAVFTIPTREERSYAEVELEIVPITTLSFLYRKIIDNERVTYSIEGYYTNTVNGKTTHTIELQNLYTPNIDMPLTFIPFPDAETYGYDYNEWVDVPIENN